MAQSTQSRWGRLWNHKDFMRLWFGLSVSGFTNQITNLALPTIAILVLHITVFEVGLLGTVEYLAYPAIGLLVGVWVDRHRRKPVLAMCYVASAASLVSIPIAYFLGVLSVYQIFAIAAVSGVISVFYNVAYQSYLPSLVDSSDLVEGNSKIQVTASAASVVGPTLAGFLINLVGTAYAIVTDVGGYLVAAGSMLTIRKAEPNPTEGGTDRERRALIPEIREGIAVIVHNPVLASLTGCVTTINFGNTLASTVFLYFAYNEVHMTPLLVGLVGTSGGVAFLVSSIIANRVSTNLGIGRALTLSILPGFGWVGYPLALVLPPLPTLLAFSFIASFGVLIFNITALSLMQKITPNRLLGRMTATRRTVSWGIIPLASFLAGILGGLIGLSLTMIIGGLISGASVLWALLGPVHSIREVDGQMTVPDLSAHQS